MLRRFSLARFSRGVGVALALSVFAVACGTDTNPALDQPDPSAQQAFTPGDVSLDTVVVDGISLEIAVIVPPGFSTGDSAPVLLALPPGGQSTSLVLSTMQDIYLTQASERGWVVVSPAAPAGVKFFEGSETLIPGLLDYVSSWVEPEGGKFHLAGISNGGISSFRVATQNPHRFASVVVFPGFASSEADISGLDVLAEIPVRLFVGGMDTAWIPRMQQTEQTLRGFGGDVLLETFPGEGHIIGALNDGIRVFDELDAAR